MALKLVNPKSLEYKGDDRETPPNQIVKKLKFTGNKIVDGQIVEKDDGKYRNQVKYPMYTTDTVKKNYHVLQFEMPDCEVDISDFVAIGLKDCLAVWADFDGIEYGMVPKPVDKIRLFDKPVWLNTETIPWSRFRFNFYFAEKPTGPVEVIVVTRPKSQVAADSYPLETPYEHNTVAMIDGGFLIVGQVDSRKFEYDILPNPTNQLVKV